MEEASCSAYSSHIAMVSITAALRISQSRWHKVVTMISGLLGMWALSPFRLAVVPFALSNLQISTPKFPLLNWSNIMPPAQWMQLWFPGLFVPISFSIPIGCSNFLFLLLRGWDLMRNERLQEKLPMVHPERKTFSSPAKLDSRFFFDCIKSLWV